MFNMFINFLIEFVEVVFLFFFIFLCLDYNFCIFFSDDVLNLKGRECILYFFLEIR